MRAHFDLAVVGAGPAGAAAALGGARGGLSVALFEPQERPEKPCGEGILPAGVAALRTLGFEGLLAKGHAIEGLGFVPPDGPGLRVPLAAPGCALERSQLSEALSEAVRREPRIARFQHRVEARRETDGFGLRAGGERWLAASLIAADGQQGDAAGWLRRARGGGKRYGASFHAEARALLPGVEVHLGEESEVYLTPLSARHLNVAVLFGAESDGRLLAERVRAALAMHPKAAAYVGDWLDAPRGRLLSRARPRAVAEHRAFLAGDATGAVDPILGCGVTIALRTGLAAAQAAAASLQRTGQAERRYARTVASETRLRRLVARALLGIAARRSLQVGAARFFTAWPSAARHLARRVAGAGAAP